MDNQDNAQRQDPGQDQDQAPDVNNDVQQQNMHVNLPISPPHQAKSTLSTPIYSWSHSIQKPGVGSFDASRRVALRA